MSKVPRWSNSSQNMICKDLLPRVAFFTFIFVSVLILTPSSTFANDTGTEDEEEDDCFQEDNYYAEVFLKNSSEVVKFCCPNLSNDRECESHHHQPPTLHDFNFEKMTCMINMKNYIHCFWNITNVTKNAVYSADVPYENSPQILNCSQILEKEAVECHGHVMHENAEFILKVNISLPTLSYRIGKKFHTDNIIKPDPPDNIRISNNLTNLEINWTLSKERISENLICYKHQLKINDEVVTLPDAQFSYIKQDIDVTKTYAIQVRVKQTNSCGYSSHWSDWSSVHEVGPFENKYRVNPWVITVIAFVLPMLLLAVMLLCKCQRLPKKLFPPIPGPSVNVKNLLDNDNYIQDLSNRCVYHDTEVVHAIEERNG